MRRLAVAAVVLALLGAFGVQGRTSAAWADADPASDTLLIQNAFFPYEPNTPIPLQTALGRALTEIHATGLNLKVAIIGSPIDLGGIPDLFGMPARYATFLDTELSYRGPQPLLVVMPDGLAVRSAGPASALNGLAIDAHDRSAGLARTAVLAVERIADARGHPIAPPSLAVGGSGGGFPLEVPVAIVALGLLGAVAIRARRSRRSLVGQA